MGLLRKDKLRKRNIFCASDSDITRPTKVAEAGTESGVGSSGSISRGRQKGTSEFRRSHHKRISRKQKKIMKKKKSTKTITQTKTTNNNAVTRFRDVKRRQHREGDAKKTDGTTDDG